MSTNIPRGQDGGTNGWLRDGSLLYRLAEERRPQNRDEINVTMADESRTPEARARRAGELFDLITTQPPADTLAHQLAAAVGAAIEAESDEGAPEPLTWARTATAEYIKRKNAAWQRVHDLVEKIEEGRQEGGAA